MTRTLWRVVTGVVALLLLAASMAMHDAKPIEQEWQRPIASRGSVGEDVGNRIFTIRIQEVQLAKSVATGRSEGAARTDGIFVFLPGQVMANREDTTLADIRLHTRDDLNFASTSRVGKSQLSQPSYEPLLRYSTMFTFEIPEDKLHGVRFRATQKVSGFSELIAEVDIDLGIDEAEARRMIDEAPENYEPPDT